MNYETTYLHLSASNDEEVSEYECVFNEDVLVKKDSKIGLQSVSINFNPNQIYIDSTNNYFFLYSGGGDGFGAVNNVTGDATAIRGQLTNGQYNATTLMEELTYQLNRTNTYYVRQNTAGKAEFLATLITNKVNIQLSRTSDDLNPAATNFTANNITIDSTGAQDSFSRNAAAAAGDYSYAVYNPFWIRSRGCYYSRLHVNTVGSITGFVETVPDATVTTLPLSEYYLAVQNTGGNYTVLFNGTSSIVPAIVPANDDTIIFLIGQGNYRVIVNQGGFPGGVNTTILEVGYTQDTYKQHLHGAVSILDPTGVIDSFRFTPSGFQLATIDGIHEITNISEISTPNYISRIGATPASNPIITLTLSNGLRDVLGYQINTFSSQKNPDTWVGVQNLELISFPNAILVELVNVPLNAYDSISRRRKNILAFLPGFEQTSDTSNYYYVASEIVFINTKLFSDTLINSWRIRITDGDGDLLGIDPGKIAINLVVVC